MQNDQPPYVVTGTGNTEPIRNIYAEQEAELDLLKGKYQEILNITRRMRTYQKAFYAAKPGTLARTEALTESKKAEKEADGFLKREDLAGKEVPTLF